MNLAQINEIRATIGLPGLTVDPRREAARKRHEQNKRNRAQENRNIKAARTGRSK